jgi:hypothetical protein
MHDPLAFTPVPGCTRHDGWTPPRQIAFIAALAEIGMVSAAAKAIGMSRKSAYTLRKRPGAESFAAAWDAALEQGRANALSTAIARVMTGVATPVFYRGRQIGERRTFNDGLLIAVLAATAKAGDHALRDALEPFDYD